MDPKAGPSENTTLILSPERYAAAVSLFEKKYGLRPAPARPERLKELVAAYANLPYENLSKVIKLHTFGSPEHALRLPDEVAEDHLGRHLGGTCFSLTFFLECLLRENGFTGYKVMAHMHAGNNIHCALIVVVDGIRYLVDPGYLLTEPMQLSRDRPVRYHTPSTGVQLEYHHESGTYHLFTFNADGRKWRYRFIDQEVSATEFLKHWQASFVMPSMNSLQLTRVSKHGYLYVRNEFMREMNLSGKKNHNLKKNYHETLHELFGLDRSLIEEARSALSENRLLRRPTPV